VIVAALLVSFVLVAVGVIWRRSVGTLQRREIERLEAARATLEARKATLQRQIRVASSQSRLVPIAEQRLHMRFPDDSQILIVDRPSATARPSSGSVSPERPEPRKP
jgi:cell division protein FtsL